MCNLHSSPTSHNVVNIRENLVAGPLPDGYWVQAFQFSNNSSEPADIIAYGLGFLGAPSTIRLYVNPLNDSRQSGWKVSDIASLDFPVGMTVADLTGDGFNDVIIIDRYGPSMGSLWDAKTQDGGRVRWLRNPGKRSGQPFWEAKNIGNSTGMHRIQAGHFTSSNLIQIMALPIIAKSGDFDSPAPVIIFTPEYSGDHSNGPDNWHQSIAFADKFRLIHDVKLLPGKNGGLDVVLVSGQEGIVLFWYEATQEQWCFNVVGTGLPEPSVGLPVRDFWGSGSVDVCRVGDDDVGYIATCEGFHGHVVSVYIKDPNAPKGPESLKKSSYWTRKVIDDFGPVDSKTRTGPLHHVAAIELAPDSTTAFAVACMGVPSGDRSQQGVYLYEPINLEQAQFTKNRITGESAGRLAVADYSFTKKMDIASLSYYVPGYFTGPDPPHLRINSIGDRMSQFSAVKLQDRVLLRIPRPKSLAPGTTPTLPFWSVAGNRMSIIVLPPREKKVFDAGIFSIKVINGEVAIQDSSSRSIRTISPPPKKAEGAFLPPRSTVTAGVNGAVLIAFEKEPDTPSHFASMDQVRSDNILPRIDQIPPEVLSMAFPFVRVDHRPWGEDSGLWNNFQFFNAIGFHIYFNDDWMDRVVHIQAWTLGLGETARFHLHSETGRSFCEIHFCLSNGGAKGGMRYFPEEFSGPVDQVKELEKDYVEKNTTMLTVPDFHEHGPLWKIQSNTKMTPKLLPNGAVDYPWHAWLASEFGDHSLPITPALDRNVQRFDVWLAFEFPESAFQF